MLLAKDEVRAGASPKIHPSPCPDPYSHPTPNQAGTRLAYPQLELRVAGKAVSGADHAAWLADGTLPAEKLRYPDKVGEPNELMFEVRWPADTRGPEVARLLSLSLRAEAGALLG